MPPPERLLASLAPLAKVVEVAAGPRFGDALAVARAHPGCAVVVTDVDPRVLGAPPPLQGVVDDLLAPRPEVYAGAQLLYAVRLPAELHPAALAVALGAGAALALRLLGDEAPALDAPADEVLGEAGEAWHVWRPHGDRAGGARAGRRVGGP